MERRDLPSLAGESAGRDEALASVQQGREVGPRELTVTQNREQQTRADTLTRMHGHHCRPAIGMLKEVAAALRADNLEARWSQSGNALSPVDPRELAHDSTRRAANQ